MSLDLNTLTKHDIARMMDYAVLNRECGWGRYAEGCEITRAYRFAAFHVLPSWLKPVVNELGEFAREHAIEMGAPISFPYGTSPSAAKLREAECLIEDGATALDMVANIGWLKDGRHGKYLQECRRHAQLCHDAGINGKVIIEVGCLSDQEIETATKLVVDSGADYVKTATGTGPAGRPTQADVRRIMDTIARAGAPTKVKVSGISEPRVANAYAFIRMGANRIGTRGAPQIVDALPDMQKQRS
jgi:deoxyribose-phosphate aldolase